MHNYGRIAAVLAFIFLAACAGSKNAPVIPQSALDSAPTAASTSMLSQEPMPPGYVCLPNIPQPGVSPSIAYMDQCAVAGSPEERGLQRLSVALMYSSSKGYVEYCTGTPLRYDPVTHTGFIVTAAHCVIDGAPKRAGAPVTPANIDTFSTSRDLTGIYQSTPAFGVQPSSLNAQIQAVYVPSRYCQVASFVNGTCEDLAEQNGDIAVLKVMTFPGATLNVNPLVRLAPPPLTMASSSMLLAVGYGTNTSATPDDRVLYYINYRYFGTNAYRVRDAQAGILNGWRQNGNFYSIICQGDSGGGDFYWDGAHWDLVGAHSFGSADCGASSPYYYKAYDASADIRPFNAWIRRIFDEDTSASGCANLGTKYTCAARPQ